MREALAKLEEFHQIFGAYMQASPGAAIPLETHQGRVNLFAEELEEYRQAYQEGDLVGIADALTDLLYVLLGTIVSHGLQGHAEALFEEVHRSNLSKLDEHGHARFRGDGKVIKSARFFKPDIASILAEHPD